MDNKGEHITFEDCCEVDDQPSKEFLDLFEELDSLINGVCIQAIILKLYNHYSVQNSCYLISKYSLL